jgi:apolipoprotein N-acyltransferase
VALLGGALATLVVRRSVAVAVAAAAAVLVGAPLVPTPTGGSTAVVAVVQGNVPRLGLDAFAQRAAVLRNHADATHQLAADVRAGRVERPDLVIWPENASDLDPYTDPDAAATIDAAVKDVGVPVLVGAVLDGPGDKVRNAGIVWDPVSGAGQLYVKRHPVPFGEYMPYRSLVRRISKKVDLVPRDFAAGSRPGALTVGPARLADVICFEVAYDGVVRDAVRAGGRLLVVQTNNATFGRSGETHQQLAMGRLRAVEHGRAVLVAATSGVSAVIAPDGRVVDRSGIFTRDVLVEPVPLRDAQTPATRLGVLPELALVLLGAAAVVIGLVRR